MEHQEASRQLYAFLDGELTLAQRLAFTKHLAFCSSCRHRLEYEATVKALVGEKARQVAAPSRLRQKIIARIDRGEAQPSLWRRLNTPVSVRPLLGLGLAALLMLVAFIPAYLLYGGVGSDRVSPIFDQLATKHAVFATEESALEVAGGAAEIREWYRGKGDLAIAVPQPTGLELLGARLSDLNSERALHLIYKSQQQYVSLFLFKSLEEDFPVAGKQVFKGEEFYLGKWGERSIVLWRRGETGYALVADLEQDRLLEMAYGVRMEDYR